MCALLSSLLGAPPAASQEPSNGLMLVMDASGSMAADAGGQPRIVAAREALHALVDELPDGAQVGLTVYGHTVGNDESLKDAGCQDVEVIRPVGPLDRDQLRTDVDSFEPSGWTPIGLALQTAADALAPVAGNRTIVLVSDGEDTCAPPDPCEVAAGLAAEGIDLTIETVGFQVDDTARAQLQCIAEATGGSYRDAPDAASLASSLEALSLRAYRDYQPTGEPVTGGSDRDGAVDLAEGDYLDELAPPGVAERWYRIRVPAGDSFAISATLVGNREIEGRQATFGVEVFPADQSGRCDRNQVRSLIGSFADTAAVVGGPGTSCGDGSDFVARVALADFPDPVTFPLEVSFQTFGPDEPIPPREGLEPASPGDDVIGGSSFSRAPLVAPGTYADNIRMGESHIWAVEVARGQSLSVTYRGLPADSDETARARMLLRSGLRQAGRSGDDATSATRDFGLSEGFEASFTTPAIGGPSVHEVFARPGVFYVNVNLQRGPATVLVDYEVTFEVVGDPLPDPTPAPTATLTAAPPTTPDAATPPPTAAPGDGGADGGTPGWVWLLIGVIVGGGIAAGLAWTRRRGTGETTPP